MSSLFNWLQSLFSKKTKRDEAWNRLPYPQPKYEEPNINERNQV